MIRGFFLFCFSNFHGVAARDDGRKEEWDEESIPLEILLFAKKAWQKRRACLIPKFTQCHSLNSNGYEVLVLGRRKKAHPLYVKRPIDKPFR